MPGVKKLHQESDNSAKGEYIHGHHFGGVGVLAEAPRKKGSSVKVAELFDTHAQLFKQFEMVLYEKKETLRYFCIDLLWGEGVYQSIRFVLTDVVGGTRSIFESTDLTLTPERNIAYTAAASKSSARSVNLSKSWQASHIIFGARP